MNETGCLACASEEAARAVKAGETPDPARISPAVTWAPSPQVIRTPQGIMTAVIVIPSCLAHLAPDPVASRNGLLTA